YLFFYLIPPPPTSTLFPYTTLFRSYRDFSELQAGYRHRRMQTILAIAASILIVACLAGWALFIRGKEPLATQTAVLDLRNRSLADRKSTRLNSSHLVISYAVFCLKK